MTDDRLICGTCRWLDMSWQAGDAQPDTTGECHGAPPQVDERTGLAMRPFVELDDKACPKWQFGHYAPLSENIDGAERVPATAAEDRRLAGLRYLRRYIVISSRSAAAGEAIWGIMLALIDDQIGYIEAAQARARED